jgi:uncharacterized protein with PQ loop repeat
MNIESSAVRNEIFEITTQYQPKRKPLKLFGKVKVLFYLCVTLLTIKNI